MTYMSFKEYAKKCNISYEAVRKQVALYRKDLDAHILIDGRRQLLDEYAVEFLDEKRQKNPVSIIQQDKDAQLEDARRENKNLLITVANQANQIAELSAWKAEKAAEIEEAKQIKLLQANTKADLERVTEELKEAQIQVAAERAASERMAKEKIAEQQRADQLERELDELKNAGFFKRMFGWGR